MALSGLNQDDEVQTLRIGPGIKPAGAPADNSENFSVSYAVHYPNDEQAAQSTEGGCVFVWPLAIPPSFLVLTLYFRGQDMNIGAHVDPNLFVAE